MCQHSQLFVQTNNPTNYTCKLLLKQDAFWTAVVAKEDEEYDKEETPWGYLVKMSPFGYPVEYKPSV